MVVLSQMHVLFPSTSALRPLFALTAITAVSLFAETSASDGRELELEQLMNVKVTSVQRKEQRLAQSAAAVHVITREEIRRSGFSTIVEALRLAPGLHVARPSTNVWAISSRGFNGQFANKLQVLIDGRSVYLPTNSGVFWHSMDLMVDDIDRIEVIRGPGAAMWGANAVTGVINIITRKATETLGTFAEVGTGTEDRAVARLRYGQQIREGLAVRISSQFARRAHMEQSVLDAADSWQNGRAGFRMDWEREDRAFSLTGDLFRSSLDQSYTVPGAGGEFVQEIAESGISGGSLHGNWSQTGLRGQTTAQFSYSHVDQQRSDFVGGFTRTLDFDVQHRCHLIRRHDLVAGYGFRTNTDTLFPTWRAAFDPPVRDYNVHGFTLQYEYEAISNRLFVTGGTRLENSTLGGFSSQPTLRLLWAPTSTWSVWTAVSKAVRTPSRFELDATLILSGQQANPRTFLAQVPNPNFQSEKLRAWEGGTRWQAKKKLSLDVSVFCNSFSDLQVTGVMPPYFSARYGAIIVPVHRANGARGKAFGAEAAVTADLTYRWRVNGSVSLYDARSDIYLSYAVPDYHPDIFPGIQAQAHSTVDLHRKLQWDVSHYYTGPLPAMDLPGRQRLDTSLRFRFSEWAAISAGIQNLLNTRTPEFRPEDGVGLQRTSRTAWVRAQWWF